MEQLSRMYKEDNFRNGLLKIQKQKHLTTVMNRANPVQNRTKENPILIYSASGEGFWKHVNFFSDDWTENCPVPCKFSKEIKDFENADIIWIHESESDIIYNFPSIKQKKIAVLTLENFYRSSSVGFEHFVEKFYIDQRTLFKKWLSKIEILISTHKHSDVVVNYVYGLQMSDEFHHNPLKVRKHLMENNVMMNKKKDVLASSWISNCKSEVRNAYVTELSKYIKIDHYGGCYNTGLKGRDYDKVTQQSKYKFVLAFENTIQTDYLSEKYYEALKADSVMIYFGAPNMHEHSPIQGKIGINALDYTPEELANYLQMLNENDEKYLDFLRWRSKEMNHSFYQATRNDFLIKGKDSWICRLCQNFHQRFD
jgi:hypothetical protein